MAALLALVVLGLAGVAVAAAFGANARQEPIAPAVRRALVRLGPSVLLLGGAGLVLVLTLAAAAFLAGVLLIFVLAEIVSGHHDSTTDGVLAVLGVVLVVGFVTITVLTVLAVSRLVRRRRSSC